MDFTPAIQQMLSTDADMEKLISNIERKRYKDAGKQPDKPIRLVKKAVRRGKKMNEEIQRDPRLVKGELYCIIEAEHDDLGIVGRADVEDGVVVNLTFAKNISDFNRDRTLNTLLRGVVGEADSINGDLAIVLDDNISTRMVRFLEQYGFRKIAEDVYKREAGSIVPPTVLF